MSESYDDRGLNGDGVEPTEAGGMEDVALDGLLASWAERHSPTTDQLDAIRRAILADAQAAGAWGVSQATLPAAWWRDFFRDLQFSIRRAANVEAVLAATGSSAA
mgnify:CR=1 FL=1